MRGAILRSVLFGLIMWLVNLVSTIASSPVGAEWRGEVEAYAPVLNELINSNRIGFLAGLFILLYGGFITRELVRHLEGKA